MSLPLLKKALGLFPVAHVVPPTNYRHRSVRVPTDLSVKWSVAGVERDGELLNLSATGCYVSDENELRVGDVVEIELTIPGRLTVTLKGPVARVHRDEGFALRFRRLSATQQLLLEHAVWHLSSQMEHNRPIRERIERGRAGSGVVRRGLRRGGCQLRTA